MAPRYAQPALHPAIVACWIYYPIVLVCLFPVQQRYVLDIEHTTVGSFAQHTISLTLFSIYYYHFWDWLGYIYSPRAIHSCIRYNSFLEIPGTFGPPLSSDCSVWNVRCSSDSAW